MHAEAFRGRQQWLGPAHKHLTPHGNSKQHENNGRTLFRVDMMVGVTHHYSGVIGEHTLLYRSSLGSLDQRELSFAFAFSAASRICGPLEAASTCPSGEIQIAAVPGMALTNSLPFFGPNSNRVVESASEAVAVFATALTAMAVFTRKPLSGSIMWAAESFSSKISAVCLEDVTLFSSIMTSREN